MSQIDIFNKNYERCIYRVNNAFEIKTSMKGYYRRGLAYFNLGNYYEAEKDFMKVLELSPDNKKAKSFLKKIAEKEKKNVKKL